jgi:hypothetical protein
LHSLLHAGGQKKSDWGADIFCWGAFAGVEHYFVQSSSLGHFSD